MKLVIRGNTPSKKNNKRIVTNRQTGKPFIMSSKQHNDWESGAIKEIRNQASLADGIIEYPASLRVTFFASTARKFDLDNRLSSVLDVLVKAGVIEDDNYSFVDPIYIKFGGVDRANPRAEIEIT